MLESRQLSSTASAQVLVYYLGQLIPKLTSAVLPREIVDSVIMTPVPFMSVGWFAGHGSLQAIIISFPASACILEIWNHF